jgi:hypothetical protein
MVAKHVQMASKLRRPDVYGGGENIKINDIIICVIVEIHRENYCPTLASSDATLDIITANSSPTDVFAAATTAAFDFVFSATAAYVAPFVAVNNIIFTSIASITSGTTSTAIAVCSVATIPRSAHFAADQQTTQIPAKKPCAECGTKEIFW